MSEEKLSLKSLKSENDELKSALAEVLAEVRALKTRPSAEGDVLSQEAKSIARMEADEDIARRELKRQATLTNQGKYAYRVKHYAKPLTSVPKHSKDQRRWGAEDFREPFRCNEPTVRGAERIYRERYGLRGAESQQLILEPVTK